MTQYTINHAYPGSDHAIECGHAKTGCWILEKVSERGSVLLGNALDRVKVFELLANHTASQSQYCVEVKAFGDSFKCRLD